MGGHLFRLTSSTFSKPSLSKPLSSIIIFYNPMKGYSSQTSNKGQAHGHHKSEEIRAPSTAEVLREVAGDEFEEDEQSVASQTIEKTYGGVDEAAKPYSDVQSTKDSFKDHEPAADLP